MTETPNGDPTTINPDRVVVFEDGDTGDMSRGSGPDDRSAAPDDESDSPQVPNTAAAAEQLGVTENALLAAMGDSSQGPPDFATAAVTLGVTEAELLDALGIPAGEEQR